MPKGTASGLAAAARRMGGPDGLRPAGGKGASLFQGTKPPPLDALCVGEAMWDLCAPAGVSFDHAESLGFHPGGAAVNVALALAEQGLRVGVAASLSADALGQALRARLAATGVATAHLTTAPGRTSLVLIERMAGARRIVGYRSSDEPEAALPEGFAARILFLTGLLPSPSQRKIWKAAARDARRRRIPVVIDVNARPRMWTGVDTGSALRVLREADVVKCSADDLLALGLGEPDRAVPALRASLRPRATFVLTDGPRPALAIGRFGAVEARCRPARVVDPTGCGDAFSAALLAAMAAAAPGDLAKASFWSAALRCGHALARARLSGRRS
jgi:2-dehydro-3-deoxygluconokinase